MPNDWSQLDNYVPKLDINDFVEPIQIGREPAKPAKKLLSKKLEIKDTSLDQSIAIIERMFNPVTGNVITPDALSTLNVTQAEITSHLINYRNIGKLILPNLKKLGNTKDEEQIDALIYSTDEKASGPVDAQQAAKSSAVGSSSKLLDVNILNDIFKRHQEIAKITRKDEQLNRMIDREIMSQQFGAMNRTLLQMNSFMNTTLTSYLKKSIELKYRHIFIAKDTLATMKMMSSILETKLENIKHNTGLPDVQKTSTSETLRRTIYNNVMSGLFKKMPGFDSKFVKDIGRNLRKNVYLPGKDQLYEYAYSDDSKDSASVKQLKASLRLTLPLTDKVDEMYSNTKSGAPFDFQTLRDKVGDRNPRLNKFLKNTIPEFNNRTRVANELMVKGAQATPFDKVTRTSIVEVIPGWLGKIHKGIRDLVTGKDTEEEIYDPLKRTFVGAAAFKKNMAEYMNRNYYSQVSEQGFSGVGTLSGAYDLNRKSTDKKVDFNLIKKELVIFFTNHALNVRNLNANAILHFATNDKLTDSENEYIKIVFNKIPNPLQLAHIISTAVFSDGRINKDVIDSLNNSIRKHTNDNFKERFQTLFETHGYRRYFSEETDAWGYISDDYVIKNKLHNLKDNDEAANNINNERSRFISQQRRKQQNKDRKSKQPGNYSIYDSIQGTQSFNPFMEHDDFLNTDVSPYGKNLSNQGFHQVPQSSGNQGVNLNSLLNVKDSYAIEQRKSLINSFDKLGAKLSQEGDGIDGVGNDAVTSISVLQTINTTLSGFRAEKSNIDYAILDNLMRMNATVSDSKMMSSDEKQRFGAFVQEAVMSTGGMVGSSASKFKRLMGTAWRRTVGSGNVLGTVGRMSVGYGLGGPLGMFLGYDSKDGFKRTKALAGGAMGLMGGGLKAGLGITGLSLSMGAAGVRMGMGALGSGLGMMGNLFKRKKTPTSQAEKIKEIPFIDVYTKESMENGYPVITASQQENKLVFFADGNIIKNSYSLDRQIIDRHGNVKISDTDLQSGLFDVSGKPLLAQGKSKPNENSIKSPGGVMSKIFSTRSLGATAGAVLGGPLGGILGYILGGKLANSGISQFINMKTIGGGIGGLLGGVPGALLGMGGGALIGKGASMLKDKMGFGKKTPYDGKAGTVELIKHQFKDIISRLDKIAKNTRRVDADDDDEEFRSGSFLNRMKNKVKGGIGTSGSGKDSKQFGKGLMGSAFDLMKKFKGGGMGGLLGLGGLLGGDPADGALSSMSKGRDILGTAGDVLGTGAGAAVAKKAGWFSKIGRGLGAGARMVGTAGRGLLAGAAMLPGMASTAWGATTAGLAGAGSAITGALAAIPVAGWVVLGVAAVGLGAYGAYRYFKHSEGSKQLLKERIKIYGITQTSDIDDVRKLENRVQEYISKEEGPLTEKEILRYVKRFKIPNTEQSIEMFKDFLAHRFIPQFGAYLKVIDSFGKTYKDMKKIDEKEPVFEEIKRQMISSMSSIKTSGPSFAEVLSPKKDSDEQEKDSGPNVDSEKSSVKSPVAATIAEVDKKTKDKVRDPKEVEAANKRNKKSAIPLEGFKPKDDLYNLIQKKSDSQIALLTSIHREIKLLRILTEKKFTEDNFDLAGVLSNSVGAVADAGAWAGNKMKSGYEQLKGFVTGSTADAARVAANRTGAPLDYMLTSSLLESGGGRNTKRPNPKPGEKDTIRGVWQVSDAVQKDTGVHGDKNDPHVNAVITGKYYDINRERLRKAGLPYSDADVYLAHQQGFDGIHDLYKGQVSDKLRDGMAKNGGSGMTAEQFIRFQHQKYNSALSKVHAERARDEAARRTAAEKAYKASLPKSMHELTGTNDLTQSLIDVSK